jgi:hypothetical protein
LLLGCDRDGFILAGILFGEARLLGVGLMGVSVILAGIDIFRPSGWRYPNE